MSDVSELFLDHHLKPLKLPIFLSQYAKLARQCTAANVEHIGYLKRLTELELLGGYGLPKPDLRAPERERERRMIERRIKAAKFPETKSLPLSDAMHRLPGNGTASTLPAIPSLNRPLVMDLARSAILSGERTLSLLGRLVRARRIYR